MGRCDGCGKERRVRSCGTDPNGDPDAPDLCFLCEREGERGRLFDREAGKYRDGNEMLAEDDAKNLALHPPVLSGDPEDPDIPF